MYAPVAQEAQVALPPETQEPQQPEQALQLPELQQPESATHPQEPPQTLVSSDPPTDSEEAAETRENQPASEETAEESKENSKRSVVKSKNVRAPASTAKGAQGGMARLGPNFPIKVKEIFQAEAIAAAKAVKKGIYVGWRCPEYNWDCIRLGDESKCFCGHLLKAHQSYTGTSVKVPCAVKGCRCPAFSFIPSRPEEIGEMWLRKRKDFDVSVWRAKCRCKHTHEEHRSWGGHACHAKDCRCQFFESAFLCAACDRKWEAHQTYFETTEMRRKSNLPFGEDYFPELRNIGMSGNAVGGSGYKSLEDEIAATTTSS